MEAAETGFKAGGCAYVGDGAALDLALRAAVLLCPGPVAGDFWPLLFSDYFFMLAFGW